jgi:hypothetical protein
VALWATAEIHLILEGPLRVLPRQIRTPGTCARGRVGLRCPRWPRPQEHEDRAGGLKSHHPLAFAEEMEYFI